MPVPPGLLCIVYNILYGNFVIDRLYGYFSFSLSLSLCQPALGCDLLTLGQYLQPATDRLLPVVRYVPPEEFAELGQAAKSMGFKQVASGPFVRSSYHAREMVESR